MSKDEQVNMGKEPKTEGWFDGEKYIPFEQLTKTHLRRAHMLAQRQELKYYNKMKTFGELIDKLEEEAEKRGMILKTYKSKFHENKKVLKDTINQKD